MSSKCEIKAQKRERIDIPFSNEESENYRSFMRRTGRKAAPWVKTLILDALSKERQEEGT